MADGKRVALYQRVITSTQDKANQREALAAVAAQRGWAVVGTYEDAGIRGAKGWDKRPGLEAMLKDATRGKFEVVMCWAVDRMGHSLADLIGTLQKLRAAGVDLFLHQQALDTTHPAGKAMFGMLGVFAEFERSMIQARVRAGLDRARAKGTKLGRARIAPEREAAIRAALAAGKGVHTTARECGVGSGTVRRVRQETTRPPNDARAA